jgi:hypothetical protein
MLKDEAVVGLIMATKEDRGFPTHIRAISNGIFAIKRSGENCKARAMGGREQGNSIGATAKVSRLADKVVSERDGWVEEGKREVVKVSEVDVRHENIQVVRPHGLCEVFGVSRFRDSVRLSMDRRRDREEVSSVHNGKEVVAGITAAIITVPTCSRDRDEVIERCNRGAAIRAFLEDQLLRVLLFLLLGSSSKTSSWGSSSSSSTAGSATARSGTGGAASTAGGAAASGTTKRQAEREWVDAKHKGQNRRGSSELPAALTGRSIADLETG